MIVEVNETNINDLIKLASKVYKHCTKEDFLKENKKQFLFQEEKKFVGFLDGSIRTEYVEGCEGNKVAYLEGIYVAPQYRNEGIATRLIDVFENWAKLQGVTELASDTETKNKKSISFHEKLGFNKVSTNVHFVKNII